MALLITISFQQSFSEEKKEKGQEGNANVNIFIKISMIKR